MTLDLDSESWKTKPTDRFVLKWVKCHLSARVTPKLLNLEWLRPWMITVSSTIIGVLAGVLFGLGRGFTAGLTAVISQVLDGVDGQFARLTGRQSPSGALLDSALDRYSDGSLMIGMTVYLIRLPAPLPAWQVLCVASLAIMGSNLVSYSAARAESLELPVPSKHTLASKGTRTMAVALCGILTPLWPALPLAALCYLAVHTNLVVANRLAHAVKHHGKGPTHD
ncbi:MAG: CDP-alcohol phosphatidyltransferase family protein [Thermodesulfobacteriota bacterium]